MRNTVNAILHGVLNVVMVASMMAYVIERIAHYRTKEQFAEALEAADAGRWYWDLQTWEVKWDDQMFRLFGQDRETLKPNYEGFEKCLHPDDRERVRRKVARAIEERGGYHDTFRAITNTGEIREIRAAGLVSRDGTYMTGIHMPVTPREGNFMLERSETGSGLPHHVHYVHSPPDGEPLSAEASAFME